MFVSINLDGAPKEIAALAAELQKQHSDKPRALLAESISVGVRQKLRVERGKND